MIWVVYFLPDVLLNDPRVVVKIDSDFLAGLKKRRITVRRRMCQISLSKRTQMGRHTHARIYTHTHMHFLNLSQTTPSHDSAVLNNVVV